MEYYSRQTMQSLQEHAADEGHCQEFRDQCMGAVAELEREYPATGDGCRHCGRAKSLHCPGCGTCWPDHTCALDCDATEVEISAIAEAIEVFESRKSGW